MRSYLRVLNVMQVCQIYRSSVMVLVCALIYMPICSTQAGLFFKKMSALNIGSLYTRGTVQSEKKNVSKSSKCITTTPEVGILN